MGGLVAQVAAAEPGLFGAALETWRDWIRVEATSVVGGRVVCAATTAARTEQVAAAFEHSGWEVTARVSLDETDTHAATAALLDRKLWGVVVGAGGPPRADERAQLGELCRVLGGVAERRPELVVVLSGGALAHAERFPVQRIVQAPAPEERPSFAPSPLRDLAASLAAERARPSSTGVPLPDTRLGFRTSIASLAALIERRVEGVDVGQAGGARVLAGPDGIRGHIARADCGLVARSHRGQEDLLDDVLSWSPIRGDSSTLRDRIRNLRLFPWADASGDGARLRMAAARAALGRLDAAWHAVSVSPDLVTTPPDLLVAAGGAFAVAPPAVVALALLDTLRRPGAQTFYYDHARILGPLGTLEDETDRRRLLADLLDDALLPLGSGIISSQLRPGKQAGTVRVMSAAASAELELVPGAVQLVDLPPGIAATAELEMRETGWAGIRTRRVAVDVTGGLGGLLVDTRGIPLRLPERPEHRREQLDAWQRALWSGGDA